MCVYIYIVILYCLGIGNTKGLNTLSTLLSPLLTVKYESMGSGYTGMPTLVSTVFIHDYD